MVKIMAKHRFRNKTVELDISEETIALAEKGYNSAIYKIFELYLRRCNYSSSNLNFQSIKFWRVEKPIHKSFAHRLDNFSACEKENCSFCNVGRFEKCPNNLHPQ